MTGANGPVSPAPCLRGGTCAPARGRYVRGERLPLPWFGESPERIRDERGKWQSRRFRKSRGSGSERVRQGRSASVERTERHRSTIRGGRGNAPARKDHTAARARQSRTPGGGSPPGSGWVAKLIDFGLSDSPVPGANPPLNYLPTPVPVEPPVASETPLPTDPPEPIADPPEPLGEPPADPPADVDPPAKMGVRYPVLPETGPSYSKPGRPRTTALVQARPRVARRRRGPHIPVEEHLRDAAQPLSG